MWADAMPTMERPATMNTMAKSPSAGTARRAISWMLRWAPRSPVAIGRLDRTCSSMAGTSLVVTFTYVHASAMRVDCSYVEHNVATGRRTARGVDARTDRRHRSVIDAGRSCARPGSRRAGTDVRADSGRACLAAAWRRCVDRVPREAPRRRAGSSVHLRAW